MKLSGYLLSLSLITCISLPQISLAENSQENQNNLFKTLDKNSDGKITSDEVSKEQNKSFDRLLRIGDKDDNGELTQDEFNQAMNRKEEPVISEKEIQKGKNRGRKGKGNKKRNPEMLFKRLDKNKDGILSEDELNKKGKGAGMVKRLYKKLDKEPGDDISKEEFMEIAQAFGKNKGNKNKGNNKGFGKADEKDKFGKGPKGKKGDKMERGGRHHIPKFFEVLDSNNDHSLSKEELSKAGDLLDELDEDGDGSLSPREILGPPPEGFGNRGDRGKKGNNRFNKRGSENKKPGKNGFGNKSGKKKGFSGGKRAEKFMERFDKNDDGQLSSEELPKKFRDKFDEVDSDSDGFVTKEELSDSFQKQGKKRRNK